MWRSGLFFQLINVIEPAFWRALFSYYRKSGIIIKKNGQLSKKFKTSEGVKQGGIASPHLFNFFINGLIEECLKLDLGAKICKANVSVIAYCDDIILISPIKAHLDKLLDCCADYACKWKIEFNPKKSNYMVFGDQNELCDFKIGGNLIPKAENLIYLGLPLGDYNFIREYFFDKVKKVEKAFYSLYGLGCKPHGVNPLTMGFIYKQYCQSILRYGMELIYLKETDLNISNIRQNMLIKNAIGLGKYTRTKPLLECLGIESINQLYIKHKLFFYFQLINNKLSNYVFISLNQYFKKQNSNNNSFIIQFNKVNKYNFEEFNKKENVKKINTIFECKNKGLCDTINFIFHNFFNSICIINELNLLKLLLRVNFGENSSIT